MGRVTTEATIESLKDLLAVELGVMAADQVRRITVNDALVDTGASLLSLPTSLIRQLGLPRTGTRRIASSIGMAESAVYFPVRLTIQERSCTVDVMEVPDDVPVLIGQLPLEGLDLVVDLRHRKLIGNPTHGGEYIIEMY